jgi:regulatory protein
MDHSSPVSAERANLLATARELALSFLDRRMHSRWELERRLERSGFGAEIVAETLDEIGRAGHLDDHAFSCAFAVDRARLAPRGYSLIVKELRDRGVEREVALRAVQAVEDEHPEPEVARAFLAARRRRLAGLDKETARRRAMGWLRGRGFRTETMIRVVVELDLGES